MMNHQVFELRNQAIILLSCWCWWRHLCSRWLRFGPWTNCSATKMSFVSCLLVATPLKCRNGSYLVWNFSDAWVIGGQWIFLVVRSAIRRGSWGDWANRLSLLLNASRWVIWEQTIACCNKFVDKKAILEILRFISAFLALVEFCLSGEMVDSDYEDYWPCQPL